jgi:hypothetical protein
MKTFGKILNYTINLVFKITLVASITLVAWTVSELSSDIRSSQSTTQLTISRAASDIKNEISCVYYKAEDVDRTLENIKTRLSNIENFTCDTANALRR